MITARERGCEDIPDPENGNILFIDDITAPFSAETVAVYQCNQGYKLDRDVSQRQCLDQEFAWSGTAPECIRKSIITYTVTEYNRSVVIDHCSYYLSTSSCWK